MTRVIDLEVKRSSEYFQQGLVLSVKLEECDMEVKRRYRSQHEFYEATWPAYRPRFVTTQGSHLRICQYLAYACYLSHVHKSKSNVAAVIKLPTGAGKTGTRLLSKASSYFNVQCSVAFCPSLQQRTKC
jgi:hypothetical protein